MGNCNMISKIYCTQFTFAFKLKVLKIGLLGQLRLRYISGIILNCSSKQAMVTEKIWV